MQLLATLLPWIQSIVAVLLVTTILLQRSGESLGSAFGGDSGGVFHTKRGLERQLFIASIILAILFVGASLAALFV